MKKAFSVFFAFLLLCAALPVCADSVRSGDFACELMEDGTAKLTGCYGSKTKLTLPAVRDIGSGAFDGCSPDNEGRTRRKKSRAACGRSAIWFG